jgi:hypothetical protein
VSRRNPGVGGLSFVEANPSGRIERYTLSREVIDARARIERDFPNIRVWWDNENKEHVVCQRDGRGEESMVFASQSFHEQLIRDRLGRANNENSDAFEEIERHNAAMEAEQDRVFSEKISEVGEKLAHAFAQDGLTVRPRMAPLSTGMKKRKILQNYELPNR